MTTISLRRQSFRLLPDVSRVIVRPFIPGNTAHIAAIIGRTLALTEDEVDRELKQVCNAFDERHAHLEEKLVANFQRVEAHIFTQKPISTARKLLIGALFSGEYSLESAALFNPSIVPHPDQSGVADGALRFIMSLRATGEGHISSIEFREGILTSTGDVEVPASSRFVEEPQLLPNPNYRKRIFIFKLHEMGFHNDCAESVMAPLADTFTRTELAARVAHVQWENLPIHHDMRHTLECIQWLADSNYELQFPESLALSERIIFPVSTNESNGIEDARFVRFVEEDGRSVYFATYTAYNGRDILPQLIETTDFLHFCVLTLNGRAAQNKGMALFPRRINGNYVMLSRQDDENILIMKSPNPHYWSDPEMLLRPAEVWESVKLGNCGSPIETDVGWLVITHGVGPMRTYCIGAVLLDLDDPTRVIGRLREPLLCPEGEDREGYVPNVVYSCGSLRHGNEIILPYAMSDRTTSVANVNLDELLAALLGG